jgi:hypothetical protein
MPQRIEDLFQAFASDPVSEGGEILSRESFLFVEAQKRLGQCHAVFRGKLAEK